MGGWGLMEEWGAMVGWEAMEEWDLMEAWDPMEEWVWEWEDMAATEVWVVTEWEGWGVCMGATTDSWTAMKPGKYSIIFYNVCKHFIQSSTSYAGNFEHNYLL